MKRLKGENKFLLDDFIMQKPFEPILKKHSIFITAIGRSALGSFSRILPQMIKDCHGVHEPDVLWFYRITGLVKDDPLLLRKIRDFGFFNMTIGKLLPLRNLRGLSLALQMGKIDTTTAAYHLYKIRWHYVLRLKESIYAECNSQLAGLLDIIPLVFPNSKTVCIIRDGRSWVRSFLNRVPTLMGKKDLMTYVPYSRPRADLFPEDPFFRQWKNFSQFQRVCWLWRYRASSVLKSSSLNSNVKFIKYEDLLEGTQQYETMEEMLKYLSSFPDGFQADYKFCKENIFGKKIGQSQFSIIPHWKEWTPERVKQFQDICGEMQNRLDYGREHQWLEMKANCKPTEN
ncbi:MAG: hypothetical protein CMD96_06695 [Gammaproteobacteria bacterium]|nr:hypothetical protein [Gammaproteobacteria bacterium]